GCASLEPGRSWLALVQVFQAGIHRGGLRLPGGEPTGPYGKAPEKVEDEDPEEHALDAAPRPTGTLHAPTLVLDQIVQPLLQAGGKLLILDHDIAFEVQCQAQRMKITRAHSSPLPIDRRDLAVKRADR